MALAFGIDGRSLTLGQRIEQCITAAGGLNAAAEVVGMTPQGLRRLVREESLRGPPLLSMLGLAQKAGVTLDWIATGYDRRPDLGLVPNQQFAVVARYEAKPDGSTIEIADHGGDVAFREAWLDRLGVHRGHAGLITMRGDAMVPTIRDGATLIVDRAATAITGVGIYALLIGREIGVRRAQILRDGSVKLSADNAIYEPEVVPAGDISGLHVAGRVRAVIVAV